MKTTAAVGPELLCRTPSGSANWYVLVLLCSTAAPICKHNNDEVGATPLVPALVQEKLLS